MRATALFERSDLHDGACSGRLMVALGTLHKARPGRGCSHAPIQADRGQTGCSLDVHNPEKASHS